MVPGLLKPSNYHLIDSEATAVSALVPTDDDGDGDVDVLAVPPNADAVVVRYGNTSAGYFAARTAIGGSAPIPYPPRRRSGRGWDDDLIYGGYMNDSLFYRTVGTPAPMVICIY